MSKDLSKTLKGWDYDPNDVTVRIVGGDNGKDKVQLRVDLGVLQMEMDGRPDGERPGDCESWLEYYQQKQQAHDAAHPDTAAFRLTDEDCAKLWREGVQYYHRYLSFWHLELYDLCARDTARNLRLFAFVRDHCANDQQKLQFDQWRPYVIMMNTRSVATPLANEDNFTEALRIVEAGIDAIRDFLDEYHQSDRAEECVELVGLERWREELSTRKSTTEARRPRSAMEVLREELKAAVTAEEFEKAARLRDEIRKRSEKN